jgi:hypothetical protein
MFSTLRTSTGWDRDFHNLQVRAADLTLSKEKCRTPPAGVWGVPSFLPIIPQEWGIEGVEKSLFITLYHGARL